VGQRSGLCIQRADLGVRDGESREWASGIRAAPAQRPDLRGARRAAGASMTAAPESDASRGMPGCIQRRPRAFYCCSPADGLCAWSHVVLKTDAPCFRHLADVCNATIRPCFRIWIRQEQGATAAKVLRHTPPPTSMITDRHNLARWRLGQWHG
jgi:hypothetical protein